MSKGLDPDLIRGPITNGFTPTAESDSDESMTVLVVDDDPSMADLTATYLERESPAFDPIRETTAADALERLGEADAIVSDYDMPQTDGLEFLEMVRSRRSELPFILFTGRGNEEIASEAISAGVTDYLQKDGDSSTYSVLANRLKNSIDRYWAMETLYRSEKRFSRLVENSSDVITIIDENARFTYVSPSATDILGYEPEELTGEFIFDYAHPEDRQHAMEEFFGAIEDPDVEPVVNFRFERPDGTVLTLESRGRNLLDDDVINGFVVNSRDVTETKERERELERQNEQLRNIKRTLSHDISNHLTVADGALQLYREADDADQLDRVDTCLSRIDELLENVLSFSEQGTYDLDAEAVPLREAVTDAWSVISAEDAELRLSESKRIEADPSHLKQLLENLFTNAVEHNDGPVCVSVGTSEDAVYVEDDGAGIDPGIADEIFESGYSTDPNKAGFGLAIAERVVRSHGWEIAVSESEAGGARFEITGVEFLPELHE
ncbi:PAS domain S-box protein [Natronomonas sp.]|uniref:PAS domain S-box protein n=1 Tax=Natronomonas sp. TaxID=2184060 RepID=UPI0026132EF9|nr:PAS domain S-box protein [Natronomonas sp.]